ncbi:glycosyltransferase [Wenyingzhuangia sp. IMCC45574]
MPLPNKNICIITSSLGQGGAEKVAALQSQMLQNLGHRVFIVSILNHIEFEYAGTLLNLGALKDTNDSFLGRIHRFRIFKRFLKENNMDLLIDHRSRNSLPRELFLKPILYRNTPTIFMIHSHNLLKSFPKNKRIAHYLYAKNTTLVTVSKGIQQSIQKKYGLNNATTIYNSFQLKSESTLLEPTKEEYILFFGRLDEEAKDLAFLIEAYRNSILPEKNIQLHLLGDGPDKEKLISLVQKLNLSDKIMFMPATTNPFPSVRKAKFTVLTSHFEGFPMSIVESLACNTPVVSVDCESGPKELIKHEYNGLLVPKKRTTYTEALNSMATDVELLKLCRSNCSQSIQHLSFDKIQDEWRDLIHSIFAKAPH